MRIAIIGNAAAGKSTLARILGNFYNIPVLHMDTIGWESGWVETDTRKAINLQDEFLKNDSWVIDGGYSRIDIDKRLSLADNIIVIRLNRFYCFYRALKRAIKYRGKVRESISDGCIEKFDFDFAKWILWEERSFNRRLRHNERYSKYKDKIIILESQKDIDGYIFLITRLDKGH